jgi:hypothetical protein
VDVTSPDNIIVHGRLENGAVVNASCGVHPYHGSGHRFEIYGKEGALMMIGGGEGGEELRRKIMGGHKDDKALQELPVPEKFKWVPEALRRAPPKVGCHRARVTDGAAAENCLTDLLGFKSFKPFNRSDHIRVIVRSKPLDGSTVSMLLLGCQSRSRANRIA